VWPGYISSTGSKCTPRKILHNQIGATRPVGKTKSRCTGAAEEIPRRYSVYKTGQTKVERI
jgi:hypothetical protein